jgi:hypothetical protein
LGKGARLWLVARPFICPFSIAHSTFTSTLHFCFGLIQPLTFSIFTCECEHELDTFGTHLTYCPLGGQWITTHDAIQDIMYALIWKKWAQCMERVVVHLYIINFITNWFLHDPRRLGLRCQCGGYWPDVRDNGFECH